MAGLVRLERDGAVAKLTLARPEARNAVSRSLAMDLRQAAEACAGDPEIRAVLLKADGANFCVGGDLVELHEAGDERPTLISEITADFHRAESVLLGLSAPVVVAVQGAAAGAGMGLALMGDVVLAGKSAHFTAAYTAIGLSADGGSTYVLPRLVGLRRAQELLLTNRRLGADEALEWGLVTSVTADDELFTVAESLARRLAAGPTRAFGVVKQLLAQTFRSNFEAQTEREGREMASLSGGTDAAEGIAAFRQKREPLFGGSPPLGLG
jgi:2-(1,2-epoxy-1,2-dihydrophenyl)acetyl-CoA isomerase